MSGSKPASILSAARDLFFQFGYHKTSMDDIAVQSGMAKPTLYYYYPNKEAIFDEIVLAEAKQLITQVQKEVDPNATADQQISTFLFGIYQHLHRRVRKLAGHPEVLCDFSPHGRPIINKIREILADHLQPLLQKGKAEGTFFYQDEVTTLNSIVLMVSFLTLDWIRSHPQNKQEPLIAEMINIMLNGLRRSN